METTRNTAAFIHQDALQCDLARSANGRGANSGLLGVARMATPLGMDLQAIRASLGMPRDRLSIFRRDNYTCSYCGIQDKSAEFLLIDHAIPTERGGIHLAFNLRTSCWLCKKRKGRMSEEEFRKRLASEPPARHGVVEPRPFSDGREMGLGIATSPGGPGKVHHHH